MATDLTAIKAALAARSNTNSIADRRDVQGAADRTKFAGVHRWRRRRTAYRC
jgi:hypothetical protein